MKKPEMEIPKTRPTEQQSKHPMHSSREKLDAFLGIVRLSESEIEQLRHHLRRDLEMLGAKIAEIPDDTG